jgi:tetratricopeptide (TPR) repeat protein
MARFEKKGADGTKPNARVTPPAARKQAKAATIEDTMFFPWLRRHASWMFVVLAILIGGGLVVAGVGAGGVGVLDVFRGGGGGDSTSVSSARGKTEDNPKDPQAWRDLAVAYQTDGKFTEATAALQQAVVLRPKNTDILRELAIAQQAEATQKQQDAQIASIQGAYAAPNDPAGGFRVKGTNVIGTDKVSAAVATTYSARYGEALTAAQTASAAAVETYKRIVALQPDDPNVQLELAQAAETAQDAPSAIAAYEAFLRLAPDDSSAAIVKDRLEQLKPAPTPNP